MTESLLKKADRFGRFIENTFLTLLLLGMISLAAAQIFLRWGGAGSLSWGDEAVRLMRGPVGAEIIITVVREGEIEPFDVSIIRDTIKLTAEDAESSLLAALGVSPS